MFCLEFQKTLTLPRAKCKLSLDSDQTYQNHTYFCAHTFSFFQSSYGMSSLRSIHIVLHCKYVVTEINVRQSGICHVFGQANSIVKSMDIGMHQSMMIFGPFFHNKSLLNDKIISHHIYLLDSLGRICSATKPVFMQMNVNLIRKSE